MIPNNDNKQPAPEQENKTKSENKRPASRGERWKRKVFLVIENEEHSNLASKIFDTTICGLIILNVVAVLIGSDEAMVRKYAGILNGIDWITVVIFTVEYVLRFWVADLKFPYCGAGKARWKFVISPFALIDLLTIAPFYLLMFSSFDLRFLRVLRILRIIRLLKLVRYLKSLHIFARVIRSKKEELKATVAIAAISLVVAAILTFYLEHPAQPEVFDTLLDSFWWAVVTMTTVGYGDMYPITTAGKIIGAFVAVIGMGLIALPAGIISSGFLDEVKKKQVEQEPAKQEQVEQELSLEEDIPLAEKVNADSFYRCPCCGQVWRIDETEKTENENE